MRRLVVLSIALLGAACGGPSIAPSSGPVDGGRDAGLNPQDAGSNDAGNGSGAPVTTANPPGEVATGNLTVTLTSVPAATIVYTTDGSDPTTSATAISGQSPVQVSLTAPSQITLTFFAFDAMGTETPHSESYTLLTELQPDSITGQLFVPATLSAGQAEVWLFEQDPGSSPSCGSAYQTTTVSLQTQGDQAVGSYQFENLPAGTYWIVGAWWSGTPGCSPEASGQARLAPVSLGGAVTRADFINIYVAECDPSGTGIDGTVLIGADYQSDYVYVAAYPAPFTTAGPFPMPETYTATVGTGSTRPFALCDLVGAPLDLAALALTPLTGATVAISSYDANPVAVSPLSNVTLSLGSSASGQGGISGNITLNGPLPGGTINIITVQGQSAESGTIVNITSVSNDGTSTTFPYALAGLAAGTYTLVASLTTSGGQNNNFTNASDTVQVSAGATTPLDLTASVGMVQGTVTVSNVPDGVQTVIAYVTPPDESSTVATSTATLSAADPSGNRTATYSVFGLPDGTYAVGAVVDTSGDGNFTQDFDNDDYSFGPSAIMIVGGDTQTESWSFALPQ